MLARARALEAQGRDVVHLEIGEPDFDTPGHVIAAAQQALEAGATHYGPSAGLPELRAAVCDYLRTWRGLDVPPDRVIIGPGAKPLLFFTLLAVVNPGDEVICPDPGFPTYASVVQFAGGTPVFVPLREERQFRLDPNELRGLVTPRTRLIVLNSPHNPTGSVLTRADLEAVAEIAQERDVLVLSDEIYARLLYTGEHVSIATLPGMRDRTVVLDGWSKTWAMTGWRLGFGVFPPVLAPHVEMLATNSVGCTATFSQVAAVAALTGPGDAVDAMVRAFHERRDAMVRGLNDLPGVRCQAPAGAFYVFPSVAGTGQDERSLADALLDQAGVACLPGTDFGACGAGYLRLSYANSLENIARALERISTYLRA